MTEFGGCFVEALDYFGWLLVLMVVHLIFACIFYWSMRGFLKKPDFAYTRNVIFQNEHCEVVLIDWKPGEKSALHDHGESRGFIRVLSGQIFQDVYDKETKKSRARTFHNSGDVILETPDIIHQMGNASKEASAKTMHFYSPPLKMTDYTEEDMLVQCPICRGTAKVLKEIPSANPPEWIDCWSCDGKGKRLNY